MNNAANFIWEGSTIPLLYSSCIPVKGARRSIVCDLQKEKFVFIPNLIYKVFAEYRGSSLSELESTFAQKFPLIMRYFQSLYKNKYLFTTNTPELFPEIGIQSRNIPCHIEQAIVDIDDPNVYNVPLTVKELINLGIRHLQIRSYRSLPINFYEQLLANCIAEIEFVHLIIKYNQTLILEKLVTLCSAFPFVRSIVIHSCDNNACFEIPKGNIPIYFTEQVIDSEQHCGIISPDYFSINIRTFTDSQNRNSCLHGKIGIDKNGLIKNCPSLEASYGQINTSKLETALNNLKFYEIWKITKEQIDVCRDCEFRYICTDCRAYTTHQAHQFSKPLKCSYNPYTLEGFNGF